MVIGARRKAILPLSLAFVIFCTLAAPLVIAMSDRVGKPSYSETGSLNYAWHVNHVVGGKATHGTFFVASAGPPAYLRHPLALLFSSPEVYGFKEPLSLTYPPRSDMWYWSAGTKAVFNLRNQVQATTEGLALLFKDPHVLPVSLLILAFLLVCLVRLRPLETVKSNFSGWPLLIPGIVGPSLYVLILVEPRYVAPFFLTILLGLLPSMSQVDLLERGLRIRNWLIGTGACLMMFSALLVGYHLAGFPRGEDGRIFLQVGSALNNAGIRPGEEIAIIGDSSDGCRWARMAQVRIIAQILPEDSDRFWQTTDPQGKTEIYDAFSRAGARAVVSEVPPPSGMQAGWQELGGTNYYVHMLKIPEANRETTG